MEATRENLIECNFCEFVIPNPDVNKSINEDISKYIDNPCPNCGENLLTESEYESDNIEKEILNMYENFKKILKIPKEFL